MTTMPESIRTLFCIGVSPGLLLADAVERRQAFDAIVPAFDDLAGRFGLDVLGTIDDDQVMVGISSTWPWTAYILADAPSLDAVVAVCDIVRSTEVGSHQLWKYLKIEARVGRALFFGNA